MTVLFTHHHYGWRKHDLPNSYFDHLLSALGETHKFLCEYDGRFSVDVERTPACSYDGVVSVFWDDDRPHASLGLRRKEHWFRAFEFNVANAGACRYCGGTGMDHYDNPFRHCWACDGTATQVRTRTHRGFMKKPTIHAPLASHAEYEAFCAARPSGGGQP